MAGKHWTMEEDRILVGRTILKDKLTGKEYR